MKRLKTLNALGFFFFFDRSVVVLRFLAMANETEEKAKFNKAPNSSGVLFERRSRRLAAKKTRGEMFENEIGENVRKEENAQREMPENELADGQGAVAAMPNDHREKIRQRTNEKSDRRDQRANSQLQIDVILPFLFFIEFRFVHRRFDGDRWRFVPLL